MPYVASRSPVTFSNERGPGAFAPLSSLPKASNSKKSLFHIPSDDDQDQQEPSPPPTPPLGAPSQSPPRQRLTPTSVPFPTTSPATPTTATSTKSTSPPIQRTSSSTSVVLANGRPLKPSLKSASSSSIADDMAASGARHARAQSMPSTPAYAKNVHFKEKDEGLESVRLFRRTGKPASVSKTTSDTETETEPEPSAYPFPHLVILPRTQMYTSNQSPFLQRVPQFCAEPIIVRNIVFEKSVVVRFTLDEWTTVSEVLATYSGPVGALESLVGTNQGKTVGDLIGSLPESSWDRFNFAIKLEDYETYLWQRTLFLVRPPIIPRSVSSPVPVTSNPGLRLNLRHYAAPSPLPRTVSPLGAPRAPSSSEASRAVFGGQSATLTPPETPTLEKTELIPNKDEVDEGFATGSEDGDNAETRPDSRPQLSLKISSPVPILRASPVSPTPSPPPRLHGPFSPIREPFSPRVGGGSGDSYATLIREWCFAQGPDTFGAGTTIGAQSAVPWVGGMS
ncbi:hypothetical protein BJY52DRAFT_1189091 [Lactarius psammicola]|nr:hypothetical protein BJY52DRAFT_1189091 [Lactarius psammicola]